MESVTSEEDCGDLYRKTSVLTETETQLSLKPVVCDDPAFT